MHPNFWCKSSGGLSVMYLLCSYIGEMILHCWNYVPVIVVPSGELGVASEGLNVQVVLSFQDILYIDP